MRLPRPTILAAFIATLAQSALAASPLFSSNAPLRFELEAPFDEIFRAHHLLLKPRRNHSPNDVLEGFADPASQEDAKRASARAGKLVIPPLAGGAPISIPVRVEVRGNTGSTRAECSFRKLKIRFDAEAARGTALEGRSSLRIGTHCGDHLVRQSDGFGRLQSQLSPQRELVAYRLIEALGLETLKVRPALVKYRDTTGVPSVRPRAPEFERRALLIENVGEMGKRLGATRVYEEDINPETGADENGNVFEHENLAKIDRATLVRVYLAEALIGNVDWGLPQDENDPTFHVATMSSDVWNMKIVERPSASGAPKFVPVPNDFDLASVVAGERRQYDFGVAPQFFPRGESKIRGNGIAALLKTRWKLDEALWQAGIRELLSRRPLLERVVAQADFSGDPFGKRLFTDHFNVFFDGIQGRIEIPVLGADVRLIRDPVTEEAFEPDSRKDSGAVGPGTPVQIITDRQHRPLQTNGFIRARIADVLGSARTPALGDVWLPAGTPVISGFGAAR